MEVAVRPLTLADLPPNALKDFHRCQVTRRVKYLVQGEYKITDDYFVDEWLGCVPTEEVVPEILAMEPRDLQLEYILHGG